MNGKKICIANYGDDTTSYSCSADIPAGISELQVTSTIGLVIIIWKSIQVNVTYYLVLKVLKLFLLMEYK